MTTSHKIAQGLYLVRKQLGSGPPPPVAEPPPTHHIAIIDCSGSMSGELPQIRQQLKNKLATLLGPQDTITLIWFSGAGQCGIVVEAVPVATLQDLAAMHKAIDKWLHPQGLTGFTEPLELAITTAKKLKGNRALFFMSDGCDNQARDRKEILRVAGEVSKVCGSSTFVEYGYYADRPLLTSMAEKALGTLIFAEDFPHYEPTFASAMQKKPAGKRVTVEIEGDPLQGFAWAAHDGDLLTFGVEFSKIAVPEGVDEICYLSPSPVAAEAATVADHFTPDAFGRFKRPVDEMFRAVYGALSLFAVRMKPDVIYPLLRALGDVHFIERFSACFGKQQYSAFMDDARAAVFNAEERLVKGRDPSRVPDDNAFTVLQLLRILADEDARVLFDHPAWRYARIGRQQLDALDALSAEDQAKIDELTDKLKKTKVKSALVTIQTEIDKIMAKAPAALKFVDDPDEAAAGYAIDGLVLNEERPNVSIRVRKTGTVDISARVAATTGIKGLGSLPRQFPTWIWRNYAIIKDGLVNVEKLPVRMSSTTYGKLLGAGVVMTDSVTHAPNSIFAVIDLKPLPTINRSMVKAAYAKQLFELEWQLTQARARQKVFNTFAKELALKVSKGYGVVYGPAAAAWLEDQGLYDSNGFSPPRVQAPPSGDYYDAKKLEVSLKGFASLPSVKEVLEKVTAKKTLTGGAALMAPTIAEVEKFIATNKTAPAGVRTGWLEGMQKASVAQVRSLLFEKAQLLFSVIVGQVWFNEFPTIDDKTMTLQLGAPGLDTRDVLCTAELATERVNL